MFTITVFVNSLLNSINCTKSGSIDYTNCIVWGGYTSILVPEMLPLMINSAHVRYPLSFCGFVVGNVFFRCIIVVGRWIRKV